MGPIRLNLPLKITLEKHVVHGHTFLCGKGNHPIYTIVINLIEALAVLMLTMMKDFLRMDI